MADSMRTLIATALMTKIDTVTALKSKTFDSVRLAASDFQDWELPAVQLFDQGEGGIHERSRARKSWSIAIEVIMGPNGVTQPKQSDLWNLMQEIESAIWNEPNLGVPGVIHVVLGASSTDLHLMSPFYLGRIELSVDYYQPLTGSC